MKTDTTPSAAPPSGSTSSLAEPASTVTASSSLLSSISLVAGTTIGAGILALPAATLPAGLLPSSLLMIAVWLYMAASGLLIAEATLHTRAQLGREDLGFLATVQHQLGRWGAIATGTVYIFIHYALLVAYTARGGDILSTALTYLQHFFGFSQSVLPSFSSPVPLWCGHVVFSCLLGSLLFWGSERFVGRLNSILLSIIILAFSGLLTVTIPQMALPQLLRQHWVAVSSAIPVMFVTFVYHSVVPVITTQLNGNKPKIRQAILLGSLIPLSMFLLWNAAILGSVEWTPLEIAAESVFDPIETLRMGNAHPRLGLAISVFSELAVVTSFIGFAYGLLSVFNDLLSIGLSEPGISTAKPQPKTEKTSLKLLSYALIFVPPLILSLVSPSIFFGAIDASGALGTSLLFGILPAVMVWKLRYNTLTSTGESSPEPWVPGGKISLTLMIGIAAFVILQYVLTKVPFINI